jgi:hypothetical protein
MSSLPGFVLWKCLKNCWTVLKKNVKENYRMLKNIKECEKWERMLKNVKEC